MLVSRRSLAPAAISRISWRYTCGCRSMSTNLNPITTHTSPNPVLGHSPTAALSRRQIPTRTGLLALKKGMTAQWDDNGKRFPVTVLQLDRVQVTHIKTKSENGYNAVQVGSGARQPRTVTKAMLGHFARATVFPKRHLAEFRTLEVPALERGTVLGANHFIPGQYVDIRAVSKGKGFAGVMKRHGFKGLRASHGVSISHRSAGSMGQSQDPGRVLPGKKMAGRMGGSQVTVQNVKIIEVDKDAGTVTVKGPVPGPRDGCIMIQDAIKKPAPVVEAVADSS